MAAAASQITTDPVVTNVVPVQDNSSILDPDSNESLANILGTDPTGVIRKQAAVEVTKEQAFQILNRVKKTKDIGLKATAIAVAALFRKGAANSGASDNMEVEAFCAETNSAVSIFRYDLVMAVYAVTGHKTLRKLAEIMAPDMIKANLELVKSNPTLDLKGDLAGRINRKLA